MKENKPPAKRAVAGEWPLINESRLDELRALASQDFDFMKLIRLCEELNISSLEECCFAIANAYARPARSRAADLREKHFGEVANNYAGGGKSFKEAMHNDLRSASGRSRSIARRTAGASSTVKIAGFCMIKLTFSRSN